jgi:hypothetical protein
MPPIVQNQNNMSLIEDETTPVTTPVPDTTTEATKEEDPERSEIRTIGAPITNETKIVAASQTKQQNSENQHHDLTIIFPNEIPIPATGIKENARNIPTTNPKGPTAPPIPEPTRPTTKLTQQRQSPFPYLNQQNHPYHIHVILHKATLHSYLNQPLLSRNLQNNP